MKNNVKEIRKKVGMTIKQLAETSGACISSIVSIEQQKKNPGLKMAYSVSDSLGVSIYDAFPNNNRLEALEFIVRCEDYDSKTPS